MRNTVKLVLFSVLVLAVLLVLPNISNAAETTVNDETALREALADTSVDTIVLGNSFQTNSVVTVNRNVTIDGNYNTVSATDAWINQESHSGDHSLFTVVSGAELTLKNITLKFAPKYGVQAFDGSVILDGVTINGCTYGAVLVNGGTVTVKDLTLGYNGEGANNGIELDKGSAQGNPKLIMDGTFTTYEKDNAVRVASNSNVTTFEIENTENTVNKVFVADKNVLLTDANDNIISESSIDKDGVTATTDEAEKVVLTIVAADSTKSIVVDKDSVITEETVKNNVSLAEDQTIDGFYADSAYETAFDFSKAISANTTIYVKVALVDDTGDVTPPTDDTTDPSEEEEVVPSEEVEGEKDETPKTGVVSFVGVAIAILAIGTVSLVALKRKDA